MIASQNGKPIVPLVLQPVLNTGTDIVAENLVATFKRGYVPFREVKERITTPVSIVGAGASLATTYKDIVGDILACNSAHDFLLSKGIVPKYAMVWDAHPIMGQMIKTPHKDVEYLIASRCHPSVFEKLEGYNVKVWHALGGENVEKYLIEHKRREPMIAGGSSGVTRAMFVAGTLGYSRDMHLFGVCDPGDGKTTHVMGSLVQQNMIDIRVCGKWWKLAPWMAMQAADFKTLAPLMRGNGVNLIVHGKGFLPYTATFLGVQTPDIRISFYERYVRRPIHGALAIYTKVYADLTHNPQLLGGFNARN